VARFGGVYAFGYNSTESERTWMKSELEHSEYIVGNCPWQILGAIRAVGRACEIFWSGKQRTILPISRRPNFTKFEHNTSIGVTMKTFGAEFLKILAQMHVFPKKRKKCLKIFNALRV